MTKNKLLLLLALLIWAATGAWADSLSGEGTAGSPYLIQSNDDWTEFCTNFDTYKAGVIKLTTNVTITTPLGTKDAPFTGTFDGDGHTMNANINDNSAQGTAPFRYIKGGTIRNLVVTGSVSGTTHTSGLVGFTDGDSNTQNTIENCLVQANVTCSAHFGGLVGHGLNSKVVITGSAFTGNMAIPNKNQYAGGLLGWCGNAIVEITNSIFAGTRSGNGTVKFHPIGIFYGANSSNLTGCGNCYYTIAGTTSDYVRYTGKQARTITAGGGVTSLAIDGSATTYSVSGITVYEGSQGLKFGDVLYAGNGDAVKLAFTIDESIASDPNMEYFFTSGTFNEETSTLTMADANTILNAKVPLSGEGTAGSPYLIQNSANWVWFSQNFDTYKEGVIKLTSNINVFTPIGTRDNPFTGTFDGDGYTMNLSINDNSAQGTAPFRSISGATIRNIKVTGSVTSTQNHTSGLVGFTENSTVTIENCLIEATINCGTYCGGIVGHGLGSTLTMTGCAFTGTMNTSGNTAGGLQGWAGSNTLIMTNCIFAGAKTGGATFNPIAVNVGTATGSGNCYYTVAGNKSSNYNGKQGFTITAGEDVTSLAIDGAATTYSVSGITVYEGSQGMKFDDTYYAGNGDAVVLALTADESIASDPELEYISTSGTFNKATSTLTMGSANAVVSAMVLKALSGEGTALSPYLIQKSSDWLSFCQNFDTYKASVIKLTNNINVTTIAGTQANPFAGTFDGDGYTMTVSINDNSAQGTAPFRAIGGATISNLVVAGSVTSTQYHTAGLVGFIVSGTNTIVNCRVEATINCSTYCGGFVGNSGNNSTLNMTGCAFTGTLNTSGNYVGGMRGWGSCTLNMTNCIFAGTKTGNASFNPMALDGGNVSGCGNCYYLTAGNNTNCYAGKQAFTITAGENVTSLAIDGAATTYSVSGITVYAGTPGMSYGGNLYAGNGDAVKLALMTTDNPDPEHYTANYLPTSGTFDSSTSTLTMGSAAVTFNFQWIAFYNVTYNANDGTGAPDAQVKLEDVDLVLSSTEPTRDGYLFTGWNTAADGSGNSYAVGATYTANAAATLYAQWVEIYTVAYNANGGSGAPDAQEKVEDIDLVLSSTVPTRDGYAFKGWNTAVDGNGDSYVAGDTYTANASVTLYAQWGAIYAVTFDANGGTGAPDAQVKVDGIDLVLTNTVPTRTGYAFTGWNTKYNGNGDSYAPGATYTANAEVNLYAQWVPAYIVSVKTDTEDAVNWTITPNSAWAGQTVTATYSGKKKVKSVKAKNKPKGNGSLQDYNVTTINE